MRTALRLASVLFAAFTLTACETFNWRAEPVGRMSGALQIEWVGSDRFVYRPVPTNPLKYEIDGKPAVVPVAMYTDGGSIPRVFWSKRGLSPWSYGPAYILHDYLFNEHRCGRGGSVTFEDANFVLYDAIRILREQEVVDETDSAPRLIKAAVDQFGRGAWEKKDGCNANPPPLVASRGFSENRRAAPASAGVIVGTITLGSSR